MSYVELKHLLADLALDAIQHPKRDSWVSIAAAYGALAKTEQPAVQWETVLERASAISANLKWHPTEGDRAQLVHSGLFEGGGDVLRLRKSYLPHLAYFRRQTSRLIDAILRLQQMPDAQGPDAIRRAAVLFNAGLFFECHEWLEGIWRATDGPARNFYHGLVQIAAAFYHSEKGNLHGSRTLLQKGMRRLDSYPDLYQSVDLGVLRKELHAWKEHFERPMEAPRPERYPLIALPTGE